jgi:hypothetical protein
MPVTRYDNESKDAMDFDNVEMVDCQQVLVDPLIASIMAKLLVSNPLYASSCSIIADEKTTLVHCSPWLAANDQHGATHTRSIFQPSTGKQYLRCMARL